MPRARRLAALLASIALGGAALSGCGGAAQAQGSGARTVAVRAAEQFLHDYVAPSGRVIRRDQGGDTVSEGQGYAMLLAFASNERARFARIWRWTRTNLQQPDGLFAYHWQNGQVLDTQPAADADTQIAWALDLAGQHWSVTSDLVAARRVATAIASTEVGYDDQGHPTLAAGPWALSPGSPTQVEPGYWTFPAYRALAGLTADHRWQDLTSSDAAHLALLTRAGAQLPPDWATLGGGRPPAAEAAPQSGSPPASGEDGLRALVWSSCSSETRSLDAHWWRLVAPTAQAGPLTRNLDGSPADSNPAPLSLVAAAAAARSAGATRSVTTLLAKSASVAAKYPTYYGEAWNALGHILLTTSLIPGCAA
ncbi:MAG TPA: glycosyl hydrolase family 8 [Mycobacteriales bacterium]|nr:glycosyl hydrolase family 8 [Mycobacteriales bacterium]